MALTSFYKKGEAWHLGQYSALPSGCWSRTVNAVGQMVISLCPPVAQAPNGNVYAIGKYNEFCDEDGNEYASQEAFDEATEDFFVDALKEGVPIFFLSNINTKQITGSTEQSVVPTDCRGSASIPKNFWLKIGARIHATSFLTISTAVGQTGTIKVKIGSVEILSSSESLPNNLSDMAVYVNFYITHIGEGKVRLSGFTLIQTAQGLAAPVYRRMLSSGDIQIDTSSSQIMDVTYKFSSNGGALTTRMIELSKY